jgi:hypothetical protein
MKTGRNFYDHIKKICDEIFVSNRKGKKLIIFLLYKELTSATGMKWNCMENSRIDSSRFENLLHNNDGILTVG